MSNVKASLSIESILALYSLSARYVPAVEGFDPPSSTERALAEANRELGEALRQMASDAVSYRDLATERPTLTEEEKIICKTNRLMAIKLVRNRYLHRNNPDGTVGIGLAAAKDLVDQYLSGLCCNQGNRPDRVGLCPAHGDVPCPQA